MVETSYVSMLNVMFFQLISLLLLFAILKVLLKFQWVAATCVSVLAVTALSWVIVFVRESGVRLEPGVATKIICLIQLFIAAVCAVILIIKLIDWFSRQVSSDANVNVTERDRILRMVEEGKITAEEGCELLDAMGRSNALLGQDKFSRIDIAMLCGVALVVLGFFLPWAHLRMQQMPGSFSRVSAYQAGYHVGALGWTVFIIAILSAVPVFVTPKDFLYKISMLQIFLTLIGLVLVVINLVRAADHLGVGLIFCLIGFLVAVGASGVKMRKLAI